ncbi:DUF2961 domain-containing protein [Actinomadura rupiterrae]|uniref:DUF2961 domain-containing protein n=1 Tax=Actinomadura rupiterrae TaxID=559627 RepID=UPI002646B2DB|nr:DUF2961 domain-containing protein [Actinomadura rupiterrae]MCP2342108.1 hypothetical protein [Actinomadura rupiterrae]
MRYLARPRRRSVWPVVLVLVVSVLVAAAPCTAHADGFSAKGPVGWDTLRHLEQFATLPQGVQTRQFSSFDRAQNNNDYNHCLRHIDITGCVMAEADGPGEIDAIWLTSMLISYGGNDVGNIVVVLDGKTVLNAGLWSVVNGTLGAPFVYPLVANASQSSGAAYIGVPMTYRSSMLVYTTGTTVPDFFHVTYRAFADAEGVSTFDPADKAPDVISRLQAAGTSDPKAAQPGATTTRTPFTLAPGQSVALATLHGPASVSAVQLDLPQLATASTGRLVLTTARIRIEVDGRQTVDAPVGEFFGSSGDRGWVAALMTGLDPASGRGSSWWPMPFADNATLTLYNGSDNLTLTGNAAITSAPCPTCATALADGRIGYFHATSHSVPAAEQKTGRDYTLLAVSGHGKFAGVALGMAGPSTGAFMEGNERVYVDGSRSPNPNGTGTEDYFNSGWYFRNGPYSMPFTGNPVNQTATSGCPSDTQCVSAYRQAITDAVPFTSSINYGIEHGGTDNIAADYSSTAFWYGDTRTTQRVSDTLDVADPASETAHNYTSATPGTPGRLTDTYEGNDGTPEPVTMTGRTTRAPVTFTMAVDPANTGVTLRRTSDQNLGPQKATVTVNGAPAGTWLEPLANPNHRLLDDNFLIPPALTAGRQQLTITLTPAPDAPAAWSALRYTALSQVPPSTDTTAPAAASDVVARATTTTSALLTWQPGTADHYAVYTARGTAPTISAADLAGTTPVPSFAHDGLDAGQTWYYRVVAIDAAGHQSPPTPPVSLTIRAPIQLNAWSLITTAKGTAPATPQFWPIWPGGAQLLMSATAPGQHTTLTFNIPAAGRYDLSVVHSLAPDYGVTTLAIDGTPLGAPFNGYAPALQVTPPQDYGPFTLAEGPHTLTLTATAKAPWSTNHYAGISTLTFSPASTPT